LYENCSSLFQTLDKVSITMLCVTTAIAQKEAELENFRN
jgi:hypothetical protein